MEMYNNLLRNREEFLDSILNGETIGKTIAKLLLISFILFGCYGFVMGIHHSVLQAVTSFIKVPLLFYVTLIICFPAMYVFNTFLGSRITLSQTVAIFLTSFVITSSILISFAPVALFFLLIGSSYPFIILLHVGIFAISGISGMLALRNSLRYACLHHNIYPKQGMKIFAIWVFIFAFVATQLVWNMKPFIGNKDLQYETFRHAKGNFYLQVLKSFGNFIMDQK